MTHSLREAKFKAEIPVPKSLQLVDVADEKEAVNEEDKGFTVRFIVGPKPYGNGTI